MICLSTKLHILLLLVVILIALYLIYIYREVKVFEKEINLIKSDLLLLKDTNQKVCRLQEQVPQKRHSIPSQNSVHSAIPHSATGVSLAALPVATAPPVTPMRTEPVKDDDDSSVSSTEIKNILDNIDDELIQDKNTVIEEKRDDQQEVATGLNTVDSEPVHKNITEGFQDLDMVETPSVPSEETLQKMKYEELRALLKQHGVVAKGTKQEIIQKIIALHSE